MNKDINRIMAQINGYRMDGLGNNFIIIDRRVNDLKLSKNKIIELASKKAFEFDQLITIEKIIIMFILLKFLILMELRFQLVEMVQDVLLI